MGKNFKLSDERKEKRKALVTEAFKEDWLNVKDVAEAIADYEGHSRGGFLTKWQGATRTGSRINALGMWNIVDASTAKNEESAKVIYGENWNKEK